MNSTVKGWRRVQNTFLVRWKPKWATRSVNSLHARSRPSRTRFVVSFGSDIARHLHGRAEAPNKLIEPHDPLHAHAFVAFLHDVREYGRAFHDLRAERVR